MQTTDPWAQALPESEEDKNDAEEGTPSQENKVNTPQVKRQVFNTQRD